MVGNTHALNGIMGSVQNRGWMQQSTIPCTLITGAPERPDTGAVHLDIRRPKRDEHAEVMALIWDAESIKARAECITPE